MGTSDRVLPGCFALKTEIYRPAGAAFDAKTANYVQWCYSYKGAHRRLRKILTKYNGQDTGYLTNYASSYSIQKETFPASVFEDITAFTPSDADAVLRKIYGDYQKFLPKSKQIPHHSFDPGPDFAPRQA